MAKLSPQSLIPLFSQQRKLDNKNVEASRTAQLTERSNISRVHSLDATKSAAEQQDIIVAT
jgi:hypothetical protein